MSQSEIILERYRAIEKEGDSLGRLIGVRRLKPSEQTKIAGMTPELTGSDEVTAAGGEKVSIPHRMPLFIAAAVCQIDDDRIPFPRSRGELDAVYDRLDQEGLAAAGAALGRLVEVNPPATIDDAKNL